MRILEDEIASDPLERGYAAMTDAQLLTSFNAADRSRNRTSMTGCEVKLQIDTSEYNALSDAKKLRLIELLKRDDLNLFGLDLDIMVDIFGASTTGSNLATARVELISRGVEIGWGDVTIKDFRLHTLSRKVSS